MTRRFALLVIFFSILIIGAGYASAFLPGGAPALAIFVFAIATAGVMTAILVLGAARKDTKLGGLTWVFLLTFVILAGGFCAALIEENPDPQSLWLGLPRGAAIIMYVVGLLPMLILPIAYAVTFDKRADKPRS